LEEKPEEEEVQLGEVTIGTIGSELGGGALEDGIIPHSPDGTVFCGAMGLIIV
jgi:hypothetical protein